MSLIFLEGYDDQLTDGSTANSRWSAVSTSGNAVVVASGGRRGSRGQPGYTYTVNNNATHFMRHDLTASEEHATLCFGVAMKHPAGTPSMMLVEFESDRLTTPVSHLQLVLGSAGALFVYRGSSTAVGTSGAILGSTANGVVPFDSQFHYVEFMATLSDTVGIIDVRVDGVSVLSLTNQDTKNGGTKIVFDRFTFHPGGTGPSFYDDMYLFNGAGGTNNAPVGDSNVEYLSPNADGTYSDWLGSDGNSLLNYALVAEIPGTLTGHVASASTDGQRDTYGLSNLSGISGTVRGAIAQMTFQKQDSGLRSARSLVRSAGVDATGPDKGPVNQVLSTAFSVFEVDPATSLAFTPAAINALELGYESRP